MRRGPVQDRTVPLQRQQTLSTARRHSLSELFQLLHDFVPRWTNKTKKKEGRLSGRIRTCNGRDYWPPSLLVSNRLLRVREAWNPKYEGSLKIEIEKGGQGFRKGLLSLPGQDRWVWALSSKGHNQLFFMYVHLCFRVGPPFLLLIRPFPNLSFPPHSMIRTYQFLRFPAY